MTVTKEERDWARRWAELLGCTAPEMYEERLYEIAWSFAAAKEAARAEERAKCAKAIEDYGDRCIEEHGGTVNEMTVFALCAEHVRQLGGGACGN